MMEQKVSLWLRDNIQDIAAALEEINRDDFFNERTIGFAGKQKVLKALNALRSALFPGVYEQHAIEESLARHYIAASIQEAAIELQQLIEGALIDSCERPRNDRHNCQECVERAGQITTDLISSLPKVREMLKGDIAAAYRGDPAAVSTEEILLCYPSLDAISIHRLAHILYLQKVPVIPRIMSEYAHQITGIDIHPGASIGKNFFIDHGTGVVIGETCTIGDDVKLYQGVTLGAKSFDLDEHGNPVKGGKRHPDVGDNVVIYAGASILGGDVSIGHHSVVGGNVWLTTSIPPYSVVYNAQPSPIVKQQKNAPVL